MPRRTPFVVELAAFVVVLGIPDGALGVLWPGMRDDFHRPIGDLGYLVVAGTVLYLIGGLAYSWLSTRVSNGALVVGACAMSAVMAGGWALVGSWALLLAAFGGFGVGRGALDAAVNADASGEIQRLGWIHAGWSAGGATGPLLVAALAGVASWRLPVAVIALAAVVLALAAVPTGGRAAYDAEASVRAPATDVPWARASIVLVAFACYTAAEIGPGAWGYAYLVDHRHLGATAAAVMVALFWVFLTAGRIALGMFGERLDSARVLAGSCGLFVLGVGLLWAGPNGVASLAMSLAGVSCAAVFPVLVNVTPAAVGAGAAHRVVGYSIAAAALGGPLAVLGEGLAANRYGVSSLAPAMTLLAILLLVPIAVLLTVLRQPLSDLSARQ